MLPRDLPSEEPAETQPGAPAEADSHPAVPRRGRLVQGMLGLLALALVIGALGGYTAGSAQRRAAQAQAVAGQAKEQFDLGVQDLQAQRYDRARQRFEYVIRLDPGYPGVAERMAEVILALNAPTSTPDAGLPPPVSGAVQDLFTQAQAAMAKGDWSAAIETLVALRAKDPGYKAVEVDGMFYAALRNRGVQRISKEGLLEEGIYDLSRAQRFGPLDHDADTWRSWAELYLLANSYMGVNWAQAAFYFAQVYAVSPYLKNDAYIKYALSAQAYGDQLMAADDPCGAQVQYDASLQAWKNATLEPTAAHAADACLEATTAPRPQPPASTPTTGPTPAELPTPTETPVPATTPPAAIATPH